MTTTICTASFLSTLSLRRATACITTITICIALFLSTLSLRRATRETGSLFFFGRHFYPRSPCGERHILRYLFNRRFNFYPRSPCGERLPAFWLLDSNAGISIHALLAESDSQQPAGTTSTTYFYPRSPCGERRDARHRTYQINAFLSTLSLRRATIRKR